MTFLEFRRRIPGESKNVCVIIFRQILAEVGEEGQSGTHFEKSQNGQEIWI